ncbi:hypothetical protein BGW42_003561 [Actinomortierella wolfii]|nr:hypothetical protein BGW42_003561 [Actinomortierella wolfii]
MYRVVPCPYEHAHEESRCAMSSSIDETHYVPIKTSRSGSESEEIFHGYHGDTPLHSPTFADKGKGKAFMQRHDHPDHFTEGGDSRGGVGGSGSIMPPDIVEDTGEGAHSLRDESLLGTAVVRTTTSTTESSGLAGSLTDDPSFLSSSFSGHPSSSESERRLSSESSTHTTTASISEGIGFSSSTLSTPTAAGHSGGGSGHINIGLSPGGGHGGGNNNTYNISHHLHYSSSGSTNNNNGSNNQGGAAFSMRDPNWTAKVETFYFRQAAINAMIVACRNYMRANERYGAAVIERTTTSRIVWNEATRQEFIWTVTPTLLDRSNPVEQELDYDESETSFMY